LALGVEAPPVFRFEAGPSLYSGMSPSSSPNPLKHVYQMVGEEPEWIRYDVWGAHLPEAPDGYELSIGAENFLKILETYGGPTAVRDWEKLAEKLRPLAKGVMGLPSTAVRGDAGIFLTLGLRYPLPFLRVLRDVGEILKPFDMDDAESPYYVEDAFLRNYLDLIAFLLQGLPANQTLTAVMAWSGDGLSKGWQWRFDRRFSSRCHETTRLRDPQIDRSRGRHRRAREGRRCQTCFGRNLKGQSCRLQRGPVCDVQVRAHGRPRRLRRRAIGVPRTSNGRRRAALPVVCPCASRH
jgi:hypothetical protein